MKLIGLLKKMCFKAPDILSGRKEDFDEYDN